MFRGTRVVLGLLAGKWSVDVLYLLASGKRRYSEVFYEVGEISKKTLTQTLRTLEHRRPHRPPGLRRGAPKGRVLAQLARMEPHRIADGDVRVAASKSAPRATSSARGLTIRAARTSSMSRADT